MRASGVVERLRRWLESGPAVILERSPGPEDEALLRAQLAAFGGRAGAGGNGLAAAVEAGLALWRALSALLERDVDLRAEEAPAVVAAAWGESGGVGLSPAAAVALIGEFLAADGGERLTPELFGRRLERQPPERLELPDRVVLTGGSLAAFLESAHFPYGQYRIEQEALFVTPSLRLGASVLEALVRSGPGCRAVGGELLVWQPVSFRVAAGTATDERHARPFVGPGGARAYLWLGPVLPGGLLVLRDANQTEIRVPVPEGGGASGAEPGVGSGLGLRLGLGLGLGEGAGAAVGDSPLADPKPNPNLNPNPDPNLNPNLNPTPTPGLPAPLRQAEEAVRRGERGPEVERRLRAVMASPSASGAALAGAGRLWEALGQPEVARAAFTMALERGSVEGALGLSRLAEARGEGVEAAARPLDAAIARNLRSAALHARYAELLAGAGWADSPLVAWHRREAAGLMK